MTSYLPNKSCFISLKLLLVLLALTSVQRIVSAQDRQPVSLTLNHANIVAGEPLFVSYSINGVPDDAQIVFKDREKGWVSALLIDAEGKEVGRFEGMTTEQESAKTSIGEAVKSVETKRLDKTVENGDTVIKYIVPKMTDDHRIIIPQTAAITKVGVYRLIVRIRMLASIKTAVESEATRSKSNSQEPSAFRVLKAIKVFRVVVSSVEPNALEKKASGMRDTFITGAGPEVSEAVYELMSLPPTLAIKEWRNIAGDPRCNSSEPASKLDILSRMLAFNASPVAIKFLGELTWDMNKIDTRPLLINSYRLSQDPATKKQIATIFANHGENIKKTPFSID